MKNYLAALAALSALAVIACSGGKKDDPPPPPAPPATIYAAGVDSNGRPQVWKDGAPMITAGIDGDFMDLFVSNGVVHAAGYVGSDYWYGWDVAYWRSDRPSNMYTYGPGGYATALTVSGNSAYIAAFERDAYGAKVYTVDANAQLTGSIDLGYETIVNALDASGGNVYSAGISGLYRRSFAATVWRNDQQILNKPARIVPLNEEADEWYSEDQFAAVKVSGSDVHAAGTLEGSPFYARVGGYEAKLGSGEGAAEGLALSGSDVFVAGTDANGGYVWKVGGSSFSNHLVYGAAVVTFRLRAIGGDLYVLAHDYALDRYTVYKNGERIHAFGAGDVVRSIFVVEQ